MNRETDRTTNAQRSEAETTEENEINHEYDLISDYADQLNGEIEEAEE